MQQTPAQPPWILWKKYYFCTNTLNIVKPWPGWVLTQFPWLWQPRRSHNLPLHLTWRGAKPAIKYILWVKNTTQDFSWIKKTKQHNTPDTKKSKTNSILLKMIKKGWDQNLQTCYFTEVVGTASYLSKFFSYRWKMGTFFFWRTQDFCTPWLETMSRFNHQEITFCILQLYYFQPCPWSKCWYWHFPPQM